VRSLALFLELLVLLPIVLVRPFAGVVLWSWISFMNPHRLVWGGVALMMPWAMIIFFATIVGCVMSREPRRVPINAVTVLVALFLLMITATSTFALAPWPDVEAKWESVSKVFLFLLLTAALLNSKERIHALIWVMVVSLAFFGIKGGGFTLIGGGANKVFGPPSSMIFDNNHLATALLVCLPLMNYLRLESSHAIVRFGFVASMVLTIFAVAGTYSRGALIALLAISAYFWLQSPNKVISGTLVVVSLALAITFMPPSWLERMHSIGEYQRDASAMGRLEVWHVAWKMATSRPLTGAGFYATYSQPVVATFVPGAETRAVHSIWLEVLAEHGFPTFFVWFGITVAGAYYSVRTIRLAKDTPELQWCANLARMSQVSIIAYLTGGSLLSLAYWDFYFTLLVTVAAVHQHVKAAVGESNQLRPNTTYAWRADQAVTS
jgi:probable O-glycosylation ligase (exosortase A-associated)